MIVRALLFAPVMAMIGCDPPPVEAVIEVTATRDGVAVSERLDSEFAILSGCGSEQALQLNEVYDGQGPFFLVALKLDGDRAVPTYMTARSGQLGGDTSWERYFEDGEGTVERGPLEDNWQDLEITARAWGNPRDPENTRVDPEDIEDVEVKISGRFYRIEEYSIEGVTRCPKSG